MKRTTLMILAALLAATAQLTAQTINWNAGVSYVYDDAGNIARIGTDYQIYDWAGRVIRSDTNGVQRTFEYDAFGNRQKCLQAGGTDCQPGLQIIGTTNRLALASYDSAGNVTQFDGHTYTYDALNMQTRDVQGVVVRDYVYTADDERIAVYTPGNGAWRWTVRDTSGKVLRELTSHDAAGAPAAGSWTWVKDYVYRDNLLLASRQLEQGTPTTYHYHLDHLGTPRRITDATDLIVGQHNYHAFGPELTQGRIDEPSLTALKYTGHERDGDLDYMHARYYDMDVGRFLSVDPVLNVKRHLQQPQGWNRYSYVENNPINNTDPTGRCTVTSSWFVPCLQAAQAVGAAVWEGFYNSAANSAIGKIFLGAQSGDMHLAMEGQVQLNHEILTGLIMTSMMPSEGSATVRTTEQGEAWVATRLVQKSGQRFFGKAPKGSANFKAERMKDGSTRFSYDTPGQVPGSKATYQKTVDATGKTIDVKKTTYNPQGAVVHTKDKLLRQQ